MKRAVAKLLSVSLLLAGMEASTQAAAAPEPPLAVSERGEILRALPDIGATTEDEALWAALLEHAATELGQRIRPAEIDRLWSVQPPQRDVAAEIAAARAEGRLVAWLDQLSPPWPQYVRLLAARGRYAALVAQGGWPVTLSGPASREGDSAADVVLLRARLATEGYLLSTETLDRRFDADLAAALRRFQHNHDLEADAVLGPETRAALNVSASERLAQIEANLERWRWLPRNLPPDRIEVDIAAADATLFRAGSPVLRMRTVVGDARHRTPMFVSRVEAVIFNPPWNVPTSIARTEILPRLRRDPGYLARNNFTYSAGRLVQRPGPDSALGVLKFDLPSPFGVYLHDTPAKAAFALRNRALSHGCMRLEKPRELATALLQPQGGSSAGVEAAIAARRTTRVAIRRPVPLYVLYWTAVVDDAGEAMFRRDVYGWDGKLAAALEAVTVAPAADPPASTDCADLPG